MGNPQLLVLFLKALVAARRSLTLYPAGGEMATAWVERLHRSLDSFFEQGLTFPIQVGRDRFVWAGEELLTIDPTLETFRFDLESRGIAGFSIEPAVEDWELRTFLELLSRPPESFSSIAGAAAYLRERHVAHVSVSAPSTGAAPGEEITLDAAGHLMRAGKDDLDLFVDAVLEMTEERLADLTYDRKGLADWLRTVGADERVDLLYPAIKMLTTLAESGGDREIRTRTLIEAVLTLPEPTLRPLLTKWLLPLAGSDLVAFNLLTQVTEDELAAIARIVPQEQLLSLSSELLEFPWEEGKRQRLLEAIALTIRRRQEPEAVVGARSVLSRDDPLLVELRREIMAACAPEVLLERSTDVLLALVFNVENEEYPAFAMDAIEEIIGDALARRRLDLAVRALAALGSSTQLGGAAMREHARRFALLRGRMAGRTQVALVAGLLRQEVGTDQIELAAEYLRRVAREGIEEFTGLLAEERDRRVRGRMCQVLASVGRPGIPVILPWIEDSRWYVVRNIVYILGKVADESTFMSVVSVLDHQDPRVRLEAMRALALIGGDKACGPLLRCVTDADPRVRRAAVKALGNLRTDDAVPTLRDLVTATTASADLEIKREAIHALAVNGSPFARAALANLAGRRAWFWQRMARRVRNMAAQALKAGAVSGLGSLEGDDGG